MFKAFRETMLSSAVAGLLAALVLTLTQALWVTPLILQAETYEQAETHEQAEAAVESAHVHADEAWAPQDGWQRTLSTTASNSVLGIGFALMLSAFYLVRRPRNPLQGVAWGMAGFVVFFAAPSLGLPPELPGTEAADLADRQLWWLITAVTTALALALWTLQSRWSLRIFAVLLLVAPHFYGAPQPAAPHSLAPEALQLDFRVATLAANAAFWLALGALSAFVFQRFTKEV